MPEQLGRSEAPIDRNARTRPRAAWAAPVRAVTRILNAEPSQDRPRVSGPPERTVVVDCALYVDGVRQTGEWDYAEALDAARQRPDPLSGWACMSRDRPRWPRSRRPTDCTSWPWRTRSRRSSGPSWSGSAKSASSRCAPPGTSEHGALTETSEVVETGQVMLFIGPNFVISVRHGDACRLAPVRADLEAKQELLAQGPWAVAYAITDRVVDLYLEVADRIEDDLDTLEVEVFTRQTGGRIQRMYQMKRELVEFKRAVIPLQRPLMTLTAEVNRTVPSEIRRYFRDVQDHLARTVEQVTSYDDLLNSILQARLAQVTVEQNDDMRQIAAWAGIAAVWTAIAGIYGMNFDIMPELEWRYGYPVVLAFMLAISLVLYRWFRRHGWL